MKAKYSKNRLVFKKWSIITGILLILLLIIYAGIRIFIYKVNIFVYENIKDDSSKVTIDVAANSYPVILNNVVLGGTYKDKWVSSDKYFLNSKNKEGLEVDVFNKMGKAGTFKLNKFEENEETANIFTTTTRTNFRDEYYAVKSGSADVAKMDLLTLDDETTKTFVKNVNNALGKYRNFNNSVKIREVYEVALVPGEISYIITATSDSKTKKGVYSAVVYVDTMGKSNLVKYNYVKNVNNSENFKIYTVKFVADLNGDKKCEIILQETEEFKTTYSVLEYLNNKFYEVLSIKLDN